MLNSVLFSSIKDDWTTPIQLFNKLNSIYHFDLDACASEFNHLCKLYYTKENSCLFHSWLSHVVFINPPYGRDIYKFIHKCYLEAYFNHTKIVALLPSRTDTKWFHDFIYNVPFVRIEFIKGRLKFGGSKSSAPFPSMLVYFNL